MWQHTAHTAAAYHLMYSASVRPCCHVSTRYLPALPGKHRLAHHGFTCRHRTATTGPLHHPLHAVHSHLPSCCCCCCPAGVPSARTQQSSRTGGATTSLRRSPARGQQGQRGQEAVVPSSRHQGPGQRPGRCTSPSPASATQRTRCSARQVATRQQQGGAAAGAGALLLAGMAPAAGAGASTAAEAGETTTAAAGRMETTGLSIAMAGAGETITAALGAGVRPPAGAGVAGGPLGHPQLPRASHQPPAAPSSSSSRPDAARPGQRPSPHPGHSPRRRHLSSSSSTRSTSTSSCPRCAPSSTQQLQTLTPLSLSQARPLPRARHPPARPGQCTLRRVSPSSRHTACPCPWPTLSTQAWQHTRAWATPGPSQTPP